MAGFEGHARQVGYALHNLPDRTEVPWHRVVNARGEMSCRSTGDSHELQKILLEAEGIEIVNGRIDLDRFRWSSPRTRKRNTPTG